MDKVFAQRFAAATMLICLVGVWGGLIAAPRTVSAQETQETYETGRALAPGEVDYVGEIVGVDTEKKRFTVAINRVLHRTKKPQSLDKPRTRSVQITSSTELLSADTTSLPLSMADIAKGKRVHVIAAADAKEEPIKAKAILVVIGREGATLLPRNLLLDWQESRSWTLETRRNPVFQAEPKHLTVTMPDDLRYTWDAMLFQNITLKPKTNYTLRFRTRSEKRRYITVVSGIHATGKPITDNGLTRTIAVTPDWREHVIRFETTATEPNAATIAPCFQVGGKAGSIHIADVSLSEGEITLTDVPVRAKPSDLIEAPNDPNSWMLFMTEGAFASVTAEKAAIRIEIEKSGKETWHLQLLHPGTDLIEGKEYRLSFLAKASKPRSILVSSQIQGGDYHSTGLNATVELGDNWKQYTITFRATGTIAYQNIAPQFVLGKDTNGPNTIWISNVTLKPKE